MRSRPMQSPSTNFNVSIDCCCPDVTATSAASDPKAEYRGHTPCTAKFRRLGPVDLSVERLPRNPARAVVRHSLTCLERAKIGSGPGELIVDGR